MAFPAITTTQQFSVTLAPTDRRGKPAPVQPGSVTWASSDESVATVVQDSGNELSALVVAQGVGSYTITASADADLGDGVTTITGKDSGSVSQGTAVSVGFTIGAVEEQPPAPPAPPPTV